MNPITLLIVYLAGRRARAMERDALNAMSDRDLADIGLSRAEIPAVLDGTYEDQRGALYAARHGR
ncbi:DUF1127 domain-containing protein [Novispirillum sp. DQ9]|uniref:DUF1127 domain-containing protein n=1 Tax=Novispirillum sp. DQ9 TaxID=3398612 RepID=UPI003C7CC487